MLSIRQKNILEFVVKDYVRHNRPVASVQVHKENLPQTSTATIRSELRMLDQHGFLTQEHGSGGRIPTQKAYRYFVDHCVDILQNSSDQQTRHSGKRAHGERNFSAISTALAKELSLFSAIGFFGKERKICSFGAECLFMQPELQSLAMLNNFGYILDHIEDILWRYRCGEARTANFSVFIGRENPVLQMRSFSVFRLAEKKQRQDVISFSIGPMRMDYERAVAIVASLMQ